MLFLIVKYAMIVICIAVLVGCITALFRAFFTKPKCPECSGEMEDVMLDYGYIGYRCKKCKSKWIYI